MAQCTALRFAVTRAGAVWVYSFRDQPSQEMAGEIAGLVLRLEGLFRERYRSDVSGGEFHVMQMPRYGDISSGNVIGLTSGIWHGIEKNENAQRALAHELVHPYVWVPTPRTDPLWALAIEGFSSYFHLPILAQLLGEEFYDRFMDWMQSRYLQRRKTGGDSRGRPLPPEKPLLEIGPDEFPIYKDSIGLGDRSLLLLDWLRRGLGPERFFDFTRDLFGREELSRKTFETVVLDHLPEARDELALWLETTEYPERLRRLQPAADWE